MTPHPVYEQYADADQQVGTYSAGMWIFLASEVMFFGVLFVSYTIMRMNFPDAFAAAGQHMKQTIGSINTLILLTSSLTMALAVHYSKTKRPRAQTWLLLATALIGACFLGLKVYEWFLDGADGHFPGMAFAWHDPSIPKVQAESFFYLYFAITGVHALHLTVGIVVVSTIAFLNWRKFRLVRDDFVPTELAGLYWHYVDIVWIFVYPLLYLIPPPR